jgi:hypothetical protein
MRKVWSQAELEYLTKHANELSDAQMAEQLSAMRNKKVSIASARKKRQRLGLEKMGGKGNVSLKTKNQGEENV